MYGTGHRLAAVFLAIAIASTLGIREWNRHPDGHLRIRFLNVGQGDSALITTPEGKTVLIDGGPDWSTLEELGKFLPFFHRRIDLLVLSHPNLDHLLSFPEILKRYDVGAVALSGSENSLPRYREIFALTEEKGIPVHHVSAGQTITIGSGSMLDVLWPPNVLPKGFSKNDNNQSLVLMLRYRHHSALFTGDMEKPVEETLVRARAPMKAEILKVPHHGSRTSSTTGFLLAVKPDLAVISVGKNSYGHPRQEIVQRLEKMGIQVVRTDRAGTVEVTW